MKIHKEATNDSSPPGPTTHAPRRANQTVSDSDQRPAPGCISAAQSRAWKQNTAATGRRLEDFVTGMQHRSDTGNRDHGPSATKIKLSPDSDRLRHYCERRLRRKVPLFPASLFLVEALLHRLLRKPFPSAVLLLLYTGGPARTLISRAYESGPFTHRLVLLVILYLFLGLF